jgi:hypothetical protein
LHLQCQLRLALRISGLSAPHTEHQATQKDAHEQNKQYVQQTNGSRIEGFGAPLVSRRCSILAEIGCRFENQLLFCEQT